MFWNCCLFSQDKINLIFIYIPKGCSTYEKETQEHLQKDVPEEPQQRDYLEIEIELKELTRHDETPS